MHGNHVRESCTGSRPRARHAAEGRQDPVERATRSARTKKSAAVAWRFFPRDGAASKSSRVKNPGCDGRIRSIRRVPWRMMRIRLRAVVPRAIQSHGRIRVGQVEFPPTVEADPVSPVFDGEHAAHVTVPAADHKLEQARQQFHKSCARWRRSQLPWSSSHSSRERTLARARAIAQSAAP
jgi:hypothetical protein